MTNREKEAEYRDKSPIWTDALGRIHRKKERNKRTKTCPFDGRECASESVICPEHCSRRKIHLYPRHFVRGRMR